MLAVLLTDAQSLLAECCLPGAHPYHLYQTGDGLGCPCRGSSTPPLLYGARVSYRYRPV